MRGTGQLNSPSLETTPTPPMDAPESTGSDPAVAGDHAEPWRVAIIELFVHAVQSLGLPRSLGQIYGLLYSSEQPLCMQSITQQLKISKASASQGLKVLRQLGAVKQVFILGQRREHYSAQMSLRRLMHGLIDEVVEPHLRSGSDRLEHLEQLVQQASPDQQALAKERLETLKVWNRKSRRLLPLLRNFI